MGKKKEKENKKKVWLMLTTFIVLVLAVLGIDSNLLEAVENEIYNTIGITREPTEAPYTIKNEPEFIAEDDLKVYFLDVGQADSILVVNKDETMLIDAGNNGDGKDVVNFIKDKGIKKINYVIGTHPHEDHIGGLDDVINSFEIGKVYMPNVQTTTKTFTDVLTAIQKKGLKIRSPEVGFKFKVGEAECEIMSVGTDTENLNSTSIIIRLLFGNKSFLFTGDAEISNEKARQWPQTTVLKVGHHGSSSSSSQKFLNQVKPEIAVITCEKGNDYGHPHKITLDKLKKVGATIYRTDLNGTITITTDGNKLEVITEK